MWISLNYSGLYAAFELWKMCQWQVLGSLFQHFSHLCYLSSRRMALPLYESIYHYLTILHMLEYSQWFVIYLLLYQSILQLPRNAFISIDTFCKLHDVFCHNKLNQVCKSKLSSHTIANKSKLFDEHEKGIQATLCPNKVPLVISTFGATQKPYETQCCPEICTSKVTYAILMNACKAMNHSFLNNCA